MEATSWSGGIAEGTSRGGVVGSPFIEFHRVRAQSHKAIVAPDRPMTNAERKAMEEKISNEWAGIVANPEEHALWHAMFQSRPKAPRPRSSHGGGPRLASSNVLVATDAPQAKRFSGLWQVSDDKNCVLPPKGVADFSNQAKTQKRLLDQEVRDSVIIGGSVRARKSDTDPNMNSLFGCHAAKKRMCAGITAWIASRPSDWMPSLRA